MVHSNFQFKRRAQRANQKYDELSARMDQIDLEVEAFDRRIEMVRNSDMPKERKDEMIADMQREKLPLLNKIISLSKAQIGYCKTAEIATLGDLLDRNRITVPQVIILRAMLGH